MTELSKEERSKIEPCLCGCDNPELITGHNKYSGIIWNPDMSGAKQESVTITFSGCKNCGMCTGVELY